MRLPGVHGGIAPRALRIVTALLVLIALAYLFQDALVRPFLRAPQPPDELSGSALADVPASSVESVAVGLETPWEIAFLPGGDLLVTERPGRLVRLPAVAPGGSPVGPADGSVWEVRGVVEVGEGGLMGLALHPEFERTGWIYLMLTGEGRDGLENRVERYRFTDGGPVERTVIVDGIPGARFHDGGRIAFGPDGHLYVTTGDAGRPARAQDRESLAGKVLRVDADGAVPPDNPFGTLVWSWGHRNAQGLAWDDEGRLWSTEHGRSGLRSGLDELNRIEIGRNHGWPEIEGDETAPDMEAPALHSGPDYTWAPAGAAWSGGSLYFAGLRGQALYEARLRGDEVVGYRAHFASDFGRLRAVRLGPDGMLYISTSNRDGRGRPRADDDRILRLDPAVLR